MKQIAVMIMACSLLSACSQSDEPNHAPRQLQITVESPVSVAASSEEKSRDFIQAASPGRLQARSVVQPRSYNPDRLQLSVRLNGVAATARQIDDSNTFEVSGTFTGSTVRIDISWSELFQQTILQLATFSRTFPISDQAPINIEATDYSTSLFDDDEDGDSNIAERFANTSPFNSNECSDCRSDVDSHIARIAQELAPRIDGSYDRAWDDSQFKDLDGDMLINQPVDIGTPIANAASVYPGGVPPFRWASLHDGEFLYLLILGESASTNTQTPFRDSDNITEDDSVFIRLETAAGTQGYNIPLLDSNGGSNLGEVSVNSGAEPGAGVGGVGQTTENGVLIAACRCFDAQSIWEVRIPLITTRTEVENGVPFKMVVGVVDDIDGGDADFYWRWPRDSTRFDGTVVLQ